ncbi:hypothetical protein SEA_MARGARET_27 [Gordonia phage Margaret]|nr:hypothetical protein SEA_MARGARET_27 [Gordonia phage Margaret]
MNDLWLLLLSNVGCLAIGFLIGQSIRWKRTPRGLVVPAGYTSPRSMGLLSIVVMLVAFGTLVQGTVIMNRQAETVRVQTNCNNEFRKTLKIRSDAANVQTTAIVDLARALTRPDLSKADQDMVFNNFISTLEKYVTTRQSNPYPDPVC